MLSESKNSDLAKCPGNFWELESLLIILNNQADINQPQTALQTSTETDVTTTTIYTSSSSSPPAACTPGPDITINEGGQFIQIFAGSGVSENPNNPSNQASPDVTTFPGSLTDCAAAQACAEFVFNSANNDYNFDLHYLISENVWSCTGYYNALSSSSDWNVANSDIGNSYGYEY